MTAKFHTMIIGAGPAGITAAISAKRKGNNVLVCEKMPRPGKKILISGSGRCNLSNETLEDRYYNASSRHLVRSVLDRFGKSDIVRFFEELGVRLYTEKGRVFPATNQASSVLRALEIELERLRIPLELNFKAERILEDKGAFTVASSDGKRIECEKIVVAGGGMAYPALGSDGNCYKFAKQFGHRMIEPVPSAVALVIKDRLCHILQGQRIHARARAIIDGKSLQEASGELLFTKYGLSGTAILDISEPISIAKNRLSSKDVTVCIDTVPFLSQKELGEELKRRAAKNLKREEILVGILPNKLATAFKDLLNGPDSDKMALKLKEMRFDVTGTRGWNEAEFTCGGVDTEDIKGASLESKKKRGLYFAGEILDVQGQRGGYNLAWAWASGYVAGLTE